LSFIDLVPSFAVVAIVAAALGYAWARIDNYLAARQGEPQAMALQQALADLLAQSERTERELRRDISDAARMTRQEQQESLALFQRNLNEQLALHQRAMTDTLQQRLDEIRRTVDEKLQTQLEQKLEQSFRQVAERLQQVQVGLGQMQVMAQEVGNLQRVLSNVKTRGMFGEIQLHALLEQVLTPDQFAAQAAIIPGKSVTVDFAVRLPGRSDAAGPVWLPIDAKFPREDYERLLDAQARADVAAAETAARALEAQIWAEAKSIAEKYIAVPHTTDFAILFLPSEGLYAEVLRRPGLMDGLQRKHHVTLAGPTTMLALLNSLHMGFRTLALERQAADVWKVLGAVKTEFERYGEWVAKVRDQVHKAAQTLDHADTRGRQMRRALSQVEALPTEQANAMLPPQDETGDR
jgi:DNA recombination protein RmuC